MTTFIGIDGGGTRTRGVVTDAEGRELARVEGGPGLVRSTDPAAGASALADLTERLLRAAGLAPPATAICCALAGAGRAEDQMTIAAALQREAITERIRVVTDAEAAFHDAFGEGPGILLIAGTGSIALGRNRGEIERTGGWGTLLGDEGSGYAIGLAALRAAVHAADRRGPETSLLPIILEHLELASPNQLIHWTNVAAKRDIAALAPLVLGAAEEGDFPSIEIVECAARDLSFHVAAIQDRLGPWDDHPKLALTGGLIEPGGPMRELFSQALQEYYHARFFEAAMEWSVQQGGVTGKGSARDLMRVRIAPPIIDQPVDAARGAAAMARSI